LKMSKSGENSGSSSIHKNEVCFNQKGADHHLPFNITSGKMKATLPVICPPSSSGSSASAAAVAHAAAAAAAAMLMPNLPKTDIGNAVAKVLQGYDWSLVPLANR